MPADRRSRGSFATEMDSRSAVKVGWYLLRRGLWGMVLRRPTILVEAGWYGPSDKLVDAALTKLRGER